MEKAYIISLAVHAVVAAIFVLLCAGAVIHHEPKMVVIDLDSSEPQSQGSGHAGGGGGGSAGQTLFPDKLSAVDLEKRVKAVTENQSALRPQTPAAVPAVTPADDVPRQDAAPAPTSAPAADAGNGGNSPAGGSSGSGEGTGSGTGTGDGSGIGSGSGDGAGDGNGDGQGYGDGSGDGQGSGNSQTPGTGTGPFDIDGWQAAVNANKIIRSWQSNGICRELSPFRRPSMLVEIAWTYLLQAVPGRVCSMMLPSVRPMPPAPIPIPRAAP